MTGLLNETARILSNESIGPRLHLMVLEAPGIAAAVNPGQFVHMKVPGAEEHILRRPFSIYSRNTENDTLDILYQDPGMGVEQLLNSGSFSYAKSEAVSDDVTDPRFAEFTL